MDRSRGIRTRWAAIGAACAVTLGGGTLGVVRAVQTSGERYTYVPVSPKRVLDTRVDVGAADILDATPVLLTVTGNVATTKGVSTVVPAGASGVVVNVTAVNPSVDGFVSLRPGDTTGEPDVSTLNVTRGGIFPNGATITLPTSGGAAGQMQIWFEGDGTGGRTDLLIDVVGYYIDHNHDDRYYTETETDTALATKANTNDVTNALATKANTNDVTNALATKANTSSLLASAPMLPVTVDATGNTGYFTSIAIGVNGNPIISYHDGTNGDLRVAACNNPTCTTATTTTVDATGNTGSYTSIAIGANGNPIISYYDSTNGDLRVAACNNPTCTTATKTTVDATGDAGEYTSIAIGVNGNPIISYYDFTNADLRVAACNNPTCTTATTTTVDATGITGLYTSIAIGVNGNPIISYYDSTNADLRVAACNDPTCTTATTTTVDATGDAGYYTSIAIGVNGNPIISYQDSTNADLRVANLWWMTGGR